MDQMKLKASLIKHEGYKKFPYMDTKGKITIGIGYNLSDRGIDENWISNQYQEDINYFYFELNKLSWFQKLNSDRKVVILDMAFMGLKKILEFKNMIDAINNDDFDRAADEILNSLWAKEVKGRALELSAAMRKGVYNP